MINLAKREISKSSGDPPISLTRKTKNLPQPPSTHHVVLHQLRENIAAVRLMNNNATICSFVEIQSTYLFPRWHVLVRKMIEWYVPLGADGLDEIQKRVLKDFENFDTQSNDWYHSFADPLPLVPSSEELEKSNKSFSIKEVVKVKYAERSGAISGRLGGLSVMQECPTSIDLLQSLYCPWERWGRWIANVGPNL